jgi:hypothetical protein
VMRSPLQLPDAPVSEPMPTTVKPPLRADSVLLGSAPTEDSPSEGDEVTLCWRGPGSGRTLVGVAVTQLDESKHGPARAHQLARELRKPAG